MISRIPLGDCSSPVVVGFSLLVGFFVAIWSDYTTTPRKSIAPTYRRLPNLLDGVYSWFFPSQRILVNQKRKRWGLDKKNLLLNKNRLSAVIIVSQIFVEIQVYRKYSLQEEVVILLFQPYYCEEVIPKHENQN